MLQAFTYSIFPKTTFAINIKLPEILSIGIKQPEISIKPFYIVDC